MHDHTKIAVEETKMNEALFVAAGTDCYGAQRGLGISTITFKVTPSANRDMLILENTFTAPGGPARHLHHAQDEFFYVVEGNFVIEVGDRRFAMQSGDALLAPRGIPHVWGWTGGAAHSRGRMLITFAPAGQMEAFFREVNKANAMPPQDPALWRAHGMELVGPPLEVGQSGQQ
jgi:mannose-6-phosphate isomerase-like protein (cupin superfamily)